MPGIFAYSRAKSKALGKVRGRPGGVTQGEAGHFTFTQPTLDALIQPQREEICPSVKMDKAAASSAFPGKQRAPL